MEGTITQQTKLIDFLQAKVDHPSKKKKVRVCWAFVLLPHQLTACWKMLLSGALINCPYNQIAVVRISCLTMVHCVIKHTEEQKCKISGFFFISVADKP